MKLDFIGGSALLSFRRPPPRPMDQPLYNIHMVLMLSQHLVKALLDIVYFSFYGLLTMEEAD